MTESTPGGKTLVEFIHGLLHTPKPPSIPEELAEIDGLEEVHEYLLGLRTVLEEFAKGDLSGDIRLRGILAGRLKALQANLLHITWQIQQVADGDFTQRVDFMGDFSTAFNTMVKHLDTSRASLLLKEEELTRLTLALRDEVVQKGRALEALKESEASFRYMAEHDPLTGVLNRRSFYDVALMELKRSKVLGYHCGLVIFDVDHFKHFNDTHGHLEGDVALKHLTRIISSALRQGDIFARYGGEEFVALLSLADRLQGESVVERLRILVEKEPVPVKSGKVPITVSIGMAIIPPVFGELRDVPFLEEVLKHADDALYKAKADGRNRLVISPYPDGAMYGAI